MTEGISVSVPGYNSHCSTRKVRHLIAGAGIPQWGGHAPDRVMVRVQTGGNNYEDVWMDPAEFEAWVARLQAMINSSEYQAFRFKQAVRDEA